MMQRLPLITLAILGIGLLMLNGCEQMADGSEKGAGAVQERMQATQDKWREVLSFKPAKKKTAQLPQTRYCYQTQSDVVCYDSPQPMKSVMTGYQDGANVSWFQPGGGSLGVSGGEPTAAYTAVTPQGTPQVAIMSDGTAPPLNDCMPGAANNPFYCNESPYSKNAVISKDITAPAN